MKRPAGDMSAIGAPAGCRGAGDRLRGRQLAAAGLSLVLTVLSFPAVALAEDRPVNPLPSFLGADSLKALEAARAEREAEAARRGQAAPAQPAITAPPQPAKADRRKAQEEEAKRRAEAMRRLAPDGGIKRVSPDEARLIEAEDAAKARADQRMRDTAAGGPSAAGALTLEQEAKAIGASAATLGDAAAQMKALLNENGPAQAAAPPSPAQSISLMEKLPTPAEAKPAPAQPAPVVAPPSRSPGGKLTDPLPTDSAPAVGSCPPAEIATASLPGGRMRLDIDSACRAGQPVGVHYGSVRFERPLDKAGRHSFTLDLFQGRGAEVAVEFKDAARQPVVISSDDLDKVSKIAVMWQAPVNLDLHAFEYTAGIGQRGHVWAGKPESAEAAQSLAIAETRGHGFLSTQSDAATPGDKVEVYTFWHVPGQDGGAVTLAVDYETRGATPKAEACGQGKLARLDMRVWRLARGGEADSEDRMLAPAPCDAPLAEAARYNPDSMPQLKVR